jgi:iron complex transport system ATP-binding protein
MDDVLSADGLSVQLGGRKVLSSVSVSAPFAQITAVLGPNGAGKSTLLRAICGLVAHEGRVLLRGESLSALTSEQRARKLAFVPQRSQLTAALQVRELVMQGRYVHRRSFARAGLDDLRAVEAALIETDVCQFAERPFNELSYGEQRRVLLARALATGAPAILLDEPAAALDIEHALRLYALLRKLASEGRCIVVVMHDLEHARRHTDRALLLRRGEALQEGKTREVVTQECVREVYRVDMIEAAGLAFELPERSP